MILDFISLFILLTGFIIGLGAVTVIDLHGFLARKNSYWTEATIRTHKITKPLIWIGIFLVIVGGAMFYWRDGLHTVRIVQILLVLLLVLNGVFLSFRISPYLLEREREGKAQEILPVQIQNQITASFVVSFVGWWGSLVLVIVSILV